MNTLLYILQRLFAAPQKPQVSAPKITPQAKCSGSDHVFIGVPVGKARLTHKCQCRLHTVQTHARRWDRR